MSDNSRKYKYLAKNIGLLTLSSFATKLLSFFLVPLYTNILTTTEYGINDLFLTTIGVLIPVLTLNIQEAVLRFALDRKYDRDSVISIGIHYLFLGTGIVLGLLVFNGIFGFFEMFTNYAGYFFLMFLSQALAGILTSYIRGIDKISDLSISSILNAGIIIGCNILFLVVFKWGLIGYFLANIMGPLIQCVYLVIRGHVLKNIFTWRHDKNVSKEMLDYSRPLILNAIGWWLNNAADKYVVIYFLGLSENGIYSVAGKIPSILNIFQSIFAQAWTLSAVKDYDPEDKSGFFANTYATYNCFMTLGCSAIIVMDRFLAGLLYAKDFFEAWRYVPWLTIAIVFGSLAGYLGGFFSAVKDSKVFAQSTLIGSGFNVIVNFALTPMIGAMGAAIATCASYAIVWIIRLLHSRKYVKFKIKLVRDLSTYMVLILQTCILYFFSGDVLYVIEILLFVIVIYLHNKEIGLLAFKVKEHIKSCK